MKRISDIVRLHPKRVALSFSKHGYKKMPVNERSLTAMISVHKEPYAHELASSIAEDYNVFVGIDGRVIAKRRTRIKKRRSDQLPQGVRLSYETAPFGRPEMDRNPAQLTTVPSSMLKPSQSITNINNAPDPKKSLVDNIKDILMQAAPVAQVIKDVTVKGNPESTSGGGGGGGSDDKKDQKKNNTWLWVALGAIALLLIVMFSKKQKIIK